VSKDVPLWVAVVIGLGPSVVAVAAIIAAFLQHHRQLEHERQSRLRDERIAAYRKLLTATTKAHTDREAVAELSAAYVEISLLASTDEIDKAADKVWVRYGTTQQVTEKKDYEASEYAQALNRARAARDKFLKLAREELGVKGRSAGFHDLEGDDPGEELPEPQEPSSPQP
jgi:heme exporter protein D